MYVYKKPKGKRVSITRKQHNKLLTNRRLSFIKSLFIKCDYYVDESGITIEHRVRFLCKLLNTMLIPIYILKARLPENYDEIKRMWWQNKYGSFAKDHIRINSNTYNEFLNLVNLSVRRMIRTGTK